jgi:phosphoglycolate phosphatase-like HAD superfamily hydrolase
MSERLTAPSAVILDIDGTLLVRSSAHLLSLAHTIGEWLGGPVGLEMRGERPVIAGRDVTGFVDAQVARVLLGDAVSPLARLHDFVNQYSTRFEADLAAGASAGDVVPGTGDCLATLAAAGVRLALGTGNASRVASAKLAAHGLGRWFEFDRDAGFGDWRADRGSVAAAAVRSLRATAGPSTWLVGDTAADVAAAKALGLTAVGVLSGAAGAGELAAAGADLVLASVSGLCDVAPGES